MPRTVADVATKEVKDLIVGDKLLTDIIGYKGKVLIHRGTTISQREVLWLKKHLNTSQPPQLSSQFYVIGEKAKCTIKTAAGDILIMPGKEVKRENLAPLLKEGFIEVEIPGGRTMFSKKEIWPEKDNWHINQFNPFVHVETTTLVNDDGTRPAGKPAKSAKAVKTVDKKASIINGDEVSSQKSTQTEA